MASRYELVRWGPAPPREPEITPPIVLPRLSYAASPEDMESWVISQIIGEIHVTDYSRDCASTDQKTDLEILLESNTSSFRAIIRGIVKTFQRENQRQFDELNTAITEIEKQLNDLKDKI